MDCPGRRSDVGEDPQCVVGPLLDPARGSGQMGSHDAHTGRAPSIPQTHLKDVGLCRGWQGLGKEQGAVWPEP